MRWSFTLPIDLRSANALIRATRGRMSAKVAGGIYRDKRNKLAATLWGYAHMAGIPGSGPHQAGRFRRVTITRLMGKGQRQWDDDAMAPACKMLRDAMQEAGVRGGRHVPGAGIVVDDSPKWSTWTYAQERAADGRPGVRVEIEEEEPS